MILRSKRCCGCLSAGLLTLLASVALAQETRLIAGQNVNMVSGTTWPDGDPFLQRQNEPTIALSTRNLLHMAAGSNDYRTVDLPGLPEGRTTGDSSLSFYTSYDGGDRWTSTLLPGYAQDMSALGQASPIFGYEAFADPVIRSGINGLFHYSGIGFNRGFEAPSAGFVATYMDLNNDERGGTIHYVGTAVYDENLDGSSFIDKPWIAVDLPRPGANHETLHVNTPDGIVDQAVECGNIYVAYARIQGEDSAAVRSQIMFTVSEDCGQTFSIPIELTGPDTINQGAAVAVEPNTGRIQVAWRQFEHATLSCTYKANFWRTTPEAWPVDQLELAGMLLRKGDSNKVVVELADMDDDLDTEAFDEFDFSDDADRPSGVLRQLLAAWLNSLSGADQSAITDVLAEAEAWLVENPLGTHPKKDIKRRGNDLRKILRDYNKGKIGPGKCEDMMGSDTNSMLGGLNPNAILVTSSSDFGETFSEPVVASGPNYFPFEQGTTEYSFRTTGYPTMVFDDVGRSYIAYTTRGLAVPNFDEVSGDGRIVVTTSMDGSSWTFPLPIDEPERPGHQIMPAFAATRGFVFLIYYDFSLDVSGVHERFVVDLPVNPFIPRHSVDVRAAQALFADIPIFTDYSVLDLPSTQASRYPYLILDNDGIPFSQQTQYNPPNLPMFNGGLWPFFGDFIDLAALHFVADGDDNWQYNLDLLLGSPVVHAVWTDNRDVVAPLDGDWSSYVPPGDGTPRQSIFDPGEMVPVCSPGTDPTVIDRTKMRNQNIYTSKLTQGLSVAVPGNNRPLGVIQRAFVAFVQNHTAEDKLFRLRVPVGGIASFDQFEPQPQIDVVVERGSSIAQTIYVASGDPSASVEISVVEVDTAGIPVVGGLSATTRINPDSTAPDPNEGNILLAEVYTPALLNPALFNPALFNSAFLGGENLGLSNPALFNPALFNSSVSAEFIQAALVQMSLLSPALFNPALFNPALLNGALLNPALFNPALLNPALLNYSTAAPALLNPALFNPALLNVATGSPALFNPALLNPALLNTSMVETSAVVQNTGNTTAAYSLNLDLGDPPEGFIFQVMVYKINLLPSVDGCILEERVEQELLVNEFTPDVSGSLLNPESTSFFVAPGDFVISSVRIVPDPTVFPLSDPATIATVTDLGMSQSVVPQAVSTAEVLAGETEPDPVSIPAPSLPELIITAALLPDGGVGTAYAVNLGTTGGDGSPVTWTLVPGSNLPPGLILSETTGDITGTPTIQGAYPFDARAEDDDQRAEQSFSITVIPGAPPLSPLVSESSAFGANTATFDPNTGLRWLDVPLSAPYSYDQTLVQLQSGGLFEGFRLGTSAEIQDLWITAGIDTGAIGSFVPQNLQPIVDLMQFVGITGLNSGNLGGGNFFDFTAGNIESGPGGIDPATGSSIWITLANIGADPLPTMTGRASFGTVPANNPNNQHGSWLTYGASIINLNLTSTTVPIGGAGVPYTATIDNVSSATFTNTIVQAWIDQPGASRPAAGAQVVCGAGTGVLPPGVCVDNLTLVANNMFAGSGTLTPGPATARFELSFGPTSTEMQTFTVPITLVPAQSFRADFDLSGEAVTGPYVCVRHEYVFSSPLNQGEGFTVAIFDSPGNQIGSWVFTNTFGFPVTNLGQELSLSGTALADGIGYETLAFTQAVGLASLQVRGHQGAPVTGACIGGPESGFVSATITTLP